MPTTLLSPKPIPWEGTSSLSPLLPRPFLKWAGGKTQLLAQYQAYFPDYFQTYTEPFVGGGALFFYLQPARARLMDINPELINVYQQVRDQVEAVIECLQIHEKHHCKSYYYQVRSQHQLAPLDRAARLIYLNKTCYNGLYRENLQGHFNVPMGSYRNPTICNPEGLRSASQALQNTAIEIAPFSQVLAYAHDRQDFVYFDPPYHPISATSNFTAYNRYGFHASDQEKLRDVFRELARRGVQVMLSNSDCPFIRGLYQGFPLHPIEASRSINSRANKRGKIKELLITSY